MTCGHNWAYSTAANYSTYFMLNYLLIGTLLGLSAGFSPGPLLTLVISETLKHGIPSGVKVALAPLVTDLPIILLTLLLLSKLTHFQELLGVISLLGGCFLLFMSYESIRTQGVDVKVNSTRPRSMLRGVLVNMLSPHPYLFWLSIGAPTVLNALESSRSAAVIFIISFYGCIIGSKVALALLVGRYKSFLKGSSYLYSLRLLGAALGCLAIFLFYDGLRLLGVL